MLAMRRAPLVKCHRFGDRRAFFVPSGGPTSSSPIAVHSLSMLSQVSARVPAMNLDIAAWSMPDI